MDEQQKNWQDTGDDGIEFPRDPEFDTHITGLYTLPDGSIQPIYSYQTESDIGDDWEDDALWADIPKTGKVEILAHLGNQFINHERIVGCYKILETLINPPDDCNAPELQTAIKDMVKRLESLPGTENPLDKVSL